MKLNNTIEANASIKLKQWLVSKSLIHERDTITISKPSWAFNHEVKRNGRVIGTGMLNNYKGTLLNFKFNQWNKPKLSYNQIKDYKINKEVRSIAFSIFPKQKRDTLTLEALKNSKKISLMG